MNSIKILYLVFFALSMTFAQSINLGVKLESLSHSYKNIYTDETEVSFLPIPLSGYLKFSILFDNKYELELKGGVQLL